MTKKDYVLLARGIVRGLPDIAARKVFAVALAEELSAENPRFDERKFYAACGLPASAV
jgi:hypothetical protein